MRSNVPSSTARLIALCTIYLDFENSPLVFSNHIDLQKLCVNTFSKRKNLLLFLLKFHFIRKCVSILEALLAPNLILHYAIRKKILNEIAVSLIAKERIGNLVVVGSGFDTFSLRARGKFNHLNIWEIDHPATQKIKRQCLEKIGQQNQDFNFFPADFLKDRWFPDDIDFSLPTLIFAEGFFMYLTRTKVKEFFQQLVSHFKAVFVLFTFIEVNESEKPIFYNEGFAVNSYLRWKREPFLWGIHEEELGRFLESLGFDLIEIQSTEDLLKAHSKTKNNQLIREKIALAKVRTNPAV
jgi:methyltransferase (TIGR00027 family)